MMNASFRTAFWALCLSLALPLALFVGAELLPEQSPATPLALGQSPVPVAPSGIKRPAERRVAALQPTTTKSKTSGTESNTKPVVLLPPEVAEQRPASQSPPAEASAKRPRTPVAAVARTRKQQPLVALDSQLETDDDSSSAENQPRVAVTPPIERRSVRFEAIEDTRTPQNSAITKQIDARLTSLQQNLDRLAQLQIAQVQQQQQQTQQQMQSDQLQKATQLLQQLQQSNQLDQIQREIQSFQGPNANTSAVPQNQISAPNPILQQNPNVGFPQLPTTTPDQTQAAPNQAKGKKPVKAKDSEEEEKSDEEANPDDKSDKEKENGSNRQAILKASPAEDGSERFSLQIRDADLTQVLEMIGQLSGKNILTTRDVVGKVTANLHQVDIDEAMNAILKAAGFVYEKDGDYIYVSSQAEAEARDKQTRKIVTKVYRPHYISVKDLKALITPLLTESVGKMAFTTPSEVGIPTGATATGGDTMTQRDALLVQDYPAVQEQVARVLTEMDVPPMQVVIEATILSVKLNDKMALGVNFALLGGNQTQLAVSGNGATLNGSSGFPGVPGAKIVPPVGQFIADTAGLKYGFIRGDISAFITALENLADTNLIATPQLMVLNKQKAELIIGDRLSYKTLAFNGTQTVENVNFLDAGTKLRIRPFIAPDGLVRMEIHPERSSATIDSTTGLPNAQTTEVTSNVMVQDGTTVVIGGLIEEQTVESVDRVPFLGALPIVGAAFRNKTESIVRTELIVLITPRIVKMEEAGVIGANEKFENERRADNFKNRLSILNRRNLARMQYEQAAKHLERGNLTRAQLHIESCLQLNKNDRQALRLQEQIQQAVNGESRTWLPPPDQQSFDPTIPPEKFSPTEKTNAEPIPLPPSEESTDDVRKPILRTPTAVR